MRNVLYVHYGAEWIRGSERVLLDILARLDRTRFSPTLWCNGEELARYARDLDVPVRRDEFRYFFDAESSPAFSPSLYGQSVATAVRLSREVLADLIYCNGAAPAQWCLPAAWWSGAPVVVHLHSPYLRRARWVCGLHLADLLIGCSSYVLESLRADGVDETRLAVVPNGVDRDRLRAHGRSGLRASLGIVDTDVVAVIVGSLIRRKGHDVLLAAFDRVSASVPDLHLIVVGDGPDDARIRAQTTNTRVHFVGERHDVGAILRDDVDILVLPSREEAAGLVVLEAAVFGVPSIGSAVGGIPELIRDGETGLLVRAEDVPALTAALTLLATDPARRRALGAAASSHCRERFDVGVMVDRIMDRQDRVIGEAATRRRSRRSRYATVVERMATVTVGHVFGFGRSA